MLLCQFLCEYNTVLSILVLVFPTIAFLLLHLLITPYLQSSILFLLLFYCRIFSFAFAKDSHNVRLNLSTNPFVCEWYGADNLCLISNFSHNSSTNLFLKCVPLSDKIIFGHPCLHIITSYINFTTFSAVASLIGFASGHFVK